MRDQEYLAVAAADNANGHSGVAAEKRAIIELMRDCSIEVTPHAAAKIDDFAGILPRGTRVFVTSLVGQSAEDSVETARRLQHDGMTPVPHIAARSMLSAGHLDDLLGRLVGEAGVNEILLIGGGIDRSLGEFDSSMQILRTGIIEKRGIQRVGVAGHPEGSPDISAVDLQLALAEKNAFASETGLALYVVTQFCFEAPPVIAWDKAIAEQGNRMPIHIGIPGLATVSTLLKHARACGVGASMRLLTRQAANIGKLMTTRDPSVLIRALARYRATDPACGIRHCHLFPFGGLQKSVAWLSAVQAGLFELHDEGFRISAAD